MRKSQNPDGRADKSKLGRLPFAIRNAVARMLRDGATAKQVCEFVNASPDFAALRRETGCGPLNAQNVTDWRSGGYIAWCREQPFWDSTVMVINGDHPRMDTYMVEGLSYYDRPIYNCFLNPAVWFASHRWPEKIRIKA